MKTERELHFERYEAENVARRLERERIAREERIASALERIATALESIAAAGDFAETVKLYSTGG